MARYQVRKDSAFSKSKKKSRSAKMEGEIWEFGKSKEAVFVFQAGSDTPRITKHSKHGKYRTRTKRARYLEETDEDVEDPEPSSKKVRTTDARELTRLMHETSLSGLGGTLSASPKTLLDARQKTLPRYLFRGYHAYSGSHSQANDRLNNTKGITPHAFLDGSIPTSMYDIPSLRNMVVGHLNGHYIQTCFSSWSADLGTALRFSRGGNTSYIAVLDTRLMESHVQVHHVPDLFKVGLADDTYEHEWLAYGPISGIAFRCVSTSDIAKVGFSHRFAPHDRQYWPTEHKSIEQLTIGAAIKTARRIGKVFERQKEQSLDISITITAAVLSLHVLGRGSSVSSRLVDSVERVLSEELKIMQNSRGARIGTGLLVNPRTPMPRSLSGLKFMIILLKALGDRAVGMEM